MDRSSQKAAERRLNQVFGPGWARADVIEFHRREKFLLLALDESSYRELGTLVGNMADHPPDSFATEYSRLFQQALECNASLGSHFNSLQHMYGFLREKLSSSSQEHFQETLEAFYQQQLALPYVLRLFRETLKDHPDSYLADQTYLDAFTDQHPDPATLHRDVETYCNYGIHRTGTPTDHQTAQWLDNELQAVGLDTSTLDWTVPQFHLDRCEIEMGDLKLSAFPCWLPSATGEKPLQAPLACWSEKGSLAETIVLFDSSSVLTGDQINTVVQDAHARSALAVIFVDPDPGGSIAARNSRPPCVEQPQSLPCAIISRHHLDILKVTAAERTQVTLRIEGTYDPRASTRNVLGKLDRGGRWIVVSTPISGWFGCAAERGSGVAIWLALARWVAQRETSCSYLFVANSGHELNYHGAELTFKSNLAPSPAETICWIHLGANLGASLSSQATRDKPGPGLQIMATTEIAPRVAGELDSLAGSELITSGFLGEMVNVAAHDYPALGLLHHPQALPWFHTDRDTLEQVDPQALESIAQALQAMLLVLEPDARRE